MNYTEEFRLDYYTNCLYSQNPKKEDIIITNEIKNFNWHKPYFYQGFESEPPENFPHKHGKFKEGWWWGINCGYPLKIPCITINADGYDNLGYPSLQKVRKTNLHKNSILLPLEYHRHWIAYEKIYKKNFNWDTKKNDVIYRGINTGIEEKARKKFVEKYIHKYNVALTMNPNFHQNPQYPELSKESMSMEDMCQYKYIVSIEGNDKDSGINWKLASNSVVLMRRPKFESWLMEGLLVPFYHYVPLNDEFTDFEEKLEWCKNHPNECKKITENAYQFMSTFSNPTVEFNIYKKIIDFYQKKYNFIV